MKLWRRIKNLWRLSQYDLTHLRLPESLDRLERDITVLRKDFPTIAKKPAIIIPEKKEDFFRPEYEQDYPL